MSTYRAKDKHFAGVMEKKRIATSYIHLDPICTHVMCFLRSYIVFHAYCDIIVILTFQMMILS